MLISVSTKFEFTALACQSEPFIEFPLNTAVNCLLLSNTTDQTSLAVWKVCSPSTLTAVSSKPGSNHCSLSLSEIQIEGIYSGKINIGLHLYCSVIPCLNYNFDNRVHKALRLMFSTEQTLYLGLITMMNKPDRGIVPEQSCIILSCRYRNNGIWCTLIS